VKGRHSAGCSIVLEELLLQGGRYVEDQQRDRCEDEHDVEVTACFASLTRNSRNDRDAHPAGQRRMSLRRQA